jgi:CBS domain-containing protein
MQVRDVMTADVSCVRPDTPILEIARKMRDADIEAMSPGILYCFADDSVGVVSLGDLSLTGRNKAAGEALQEISQPGH